VIEGLVWETVSGAAAHGTQTLRGDTSKKNTRQVHMWPVKVDGRVCGNACVGVENATRGHAIYLVVILIIICGRFA
jgi:hypothetical protein